jgi:hypothetical protein
MSEAVFPVHIAKALDRLTVPALPTGFGDRLLARIAAGDLPNDTEAVVAALPPLRRPMGIGGWRRSGRIIVVASAFGLATATAAASGVFGDPVYIPVVSQALASAKIVEMPAKKPVEATRAKAKNPESLAIQKAAPIEPKGKEAVLAVVMALRSDPQFRGLPQPERQARLKAEIAKLIADGSAQKGDVKAAWEQLATERKLAVEARRQKRAPASSDRKEAMKLPRVRAQDKQLTPEQKAKVRDAVRELTEAERIELQSLRKRRREANPAEKRAIQAELNAFWRRVGGKPMSESAKSVTP